MVRGSGGLPLKTWKAYLMQITIIFGIVVVSLK
jgi:hypothetical protein